MMKKPKFSIVIPCYNDGDYAIEAIKSSVSQTYDNFEIIFIDDGSQDNSYEKVINFCADYDKVKCFKKANGGISSARNFGFKLSNGDFIVFLDSDDLLSRDYLLTANRELGQLNCSNIDVVIMPFLYFPMDGTPRANWVARYKPPILGRSKFLNKIKMAVTNCFPTSSVILSRQILINGIVFDESLRGYEDWDFWIKIVNRGCNFLYAPYLTQSSTRIRLRLGLSSNIKLMKQLRSVVFSRHFKGSFLMIFEIPFFGNIVRRLFILYWKLIYEFKEHPNLTNVK